MNSTKQLVIMNVQLCDITSKYFSKSLIYIDQEKMERKTKALTIRDGN